MTNEEFSNEFDTYINSFNNKSLVGDDHARADLVVDEYEKSVFLTQAQDNYFITLYGGSGLTGTSFESTEEVRRYLNPLMVTEELNPSNISMPKLSDKYSFFFELPNKDKMAFITLEQVIFSDDTLGCYNGSKADVFPTTHDEYARVKDNPFRGPTRYKVLRVDTASENIVELISKYRIGTYLIKYLRNPKPIILQDLPNGLTIKGVSKESPCELHPLTHNTILTLAVKLAMQSKGITLNTKESSS